MIILVIISHKALNNCICLYKQLIQSYKLRFKYLFSCCLWYVCFFCYLSAMDEISRFHIDYFLNVKRDILTNLGLLKANEIFRQWHSRTKKKKKAEKSNFYRTAFVNSQLCVFICILAANFNYCDKLINSSC